MTVPFSTSFRTVDHSQSTLLHAHIFTVRQRLWSKVMFKVSATLWDMLGRRSCLLQSINVLTKLGFLGSCPRKTPATAVSFLVSTFARDSCAELWLLIAGTLLLGEPGRGHRDGVNGVFLVFLPTSEAVLPRFGTEGLCSCVRGQPWRAGWQMRPGFGVIFLFCG